MVDTVTQTLPYLLQVDSDLSLISAMADRVGFAWWVDGTPLFFKKPAPGATVKLEVGKDLLFEMTPAYLEFFGFGTSTAEELRATARLQY